MVLHDIGKIYELSYDRGFGYSPEGQLLGHIAIAIRMLRDKLRAFPDFPVELRNLMEHMILSHHGQLEFGSPKVPIFPEALLLHYLDDMDSKMECMRALIEKDPQAEGYFTAYSPPLERVALRKSRYLESKPAPWARRSEAATGQSTECGTRGCRMRVRRIHAPRLPAARPACAAESETRARRQLDFRREASTGASRRKEIAMGRDRELPPPLEMMCLNALWEIGRAMLKMSAKWFRRAARWRTQPC